MLITAVWLKKKHACVPGLQWFENRFPEGYETASLSWPENEIVNDLYLNFIWKDVEFTYKRHMKDWLVDLISVIALDTDFLSPRSLFPHSEIARDMFMRCANENKHMYSHKPNSCFVYRVPFWNALSPLPIDRLNKALHELVQVKFPGQDIL